MRMLCETVEKNYQHVLGNIVNLLANNIAEHDLMKDDVRLPVT
jgi:hypothetical protein